MMNERMAFLIDVATRARESEHLQNKLAQEHLVSDILPIFSTAMESFTSEDNLEIVEACSLSLQAFVLFGRRDVLVKSSSSLTNLKLLDELVLPVLRNIKSSLITAHSNTALLFCTFVMILASDCEARQKFFVESGLHRAVIATVRQYLTTLDFVVCEMGLRALRNIAAHDEVSGDLVLAGACELLADVIKSALEVESSFVSNLVTSFIVFPVRPINQIELIEAALWAMVNLSYDSDTAAILGSVGTSRLLLDVFQLATRDITTTDHFGSEGRRIDSSAAKQMGRLNILNAFTAALRNLSYASLNFGSFEATSVCEAIVILIASFYRPSSQVDKNVTKEGDSILEDGQDDAVEREILSTAIWSLVNFTCSAKMAERFIQLNAMTAILESCEFNQARFAEERFDLQLGPIAEASIFAIRNLANNIPSSDEAEGDGGLSGAALKDKRASAFVLDMLTRYIKREGMVEACCGAITALAMASKNHRTELVKRDAFSKLFAASKEHEEVTETVEACLKSLLHLLGQEDEEGVSTFLNCRGLKFVVECLESHRRDYLIVKLCCELLLQTRFTDSYSINRLKDATQIQLLEVDDANSSVSSSSSKPPRYFATPAGNFQDIYLAWEIEKIKSELTSS